MLNDNVHILNASVKKIKHKRQVKVFQLSTTETTGKPAHGVTRNPTAACVTDKSVCRILGSKINIIRFLCTTTSRFPRYPPEPLRVAPSPQIAPPPPAKASCPELTPSRQHSKPGGRQKAPGTSGALSPTFLFYGRNHTFNGRKQNETTCGRKHTVCGRKQKFERAAGFPLSLQTRRQRYYADG